jgi:hypothetical protein
MDAQHQLIFESQISVGVLGKGEDFVLIPLRGDGTPFDEAEVDAARDRGLEYCGVLGLKDGVPGAKCEPNPDCIYTMMHAGLAFAQLVADKLRPKPKGDAVDWLTRLFELPDTRG